jgi:hypothetical protein
MLTRSSSEFSRRHFLSAGGLTLAAACVAPRKLFGKVLCAERDLWKVVRLSGCHDPSTALRKDAGSLRFRMTELGPG